MKLRTIILALFALMVTACGNSGNLYLSDEQRLRQTNDASEAARLHARAARYQQLEQQSHQMLQRMSYLRQNGKHEVADIAYIEYKKLRREMGKIILERQQESKYGDI